MAANNIPLHCNICPKRPNFSDVSHLLTHIASKGHLSNYYKVKVRSSHEESSRRLIDAYDRWYAEWGVEELMSQRMNEKDKRRVRARPAAVNSTSAPRPETPVPRPTRRVPVSNMLDPRLSDQPYIKLEPSDTSMSLLHAGPLLRTRPVLSQMQYWTSESRASSRSYANPDYETSSEYSDPSERRRFKCDATDSCAIEDDPVEAPEDPMAVSESTKLKGVYWPGMDLFDSATTEMRRKRNQKKDISVVKQLELNSQDVEPMEIIFTPRGTFKRQRRISSSEWDEDDELEIKRESPQVVKKRSALTNMDVNVRRSHQMTRPKFSFASRNQYQDRDHSIFDYSHNNSTHKRKRGFAVYNDTDNEVNFGHPAGLNYLTSGFTHQASLSAIPAFAPYKPANDIFQYTNKENILPFLQQAPNSPQNHQSFNYHQYQHGYDTGQEQASLHYDALLYAQQPIFQPDDEDDDQRTITAPPSPSTS